MRNFAYPFVSAIFLSLDLPIACSQVRAPILMQKTPKDAVPHKAVPFGGRESSIYNFNPFLPPKLPIGNLVADFRQLFFAENREMTKLSPYEYRKVVENRQIEVGESKTVIGF